MKVWVKPFGLMELLVVDQGPEFAGEEFADYFREQGVLVHFTDGQSPWQNGPTERAGGAFKEMLEKVILDATILTRQWICWRAGGTSEQTEVASPQIKDR